MCPLFSSNENTQSNDVASGQNLIEASESVTIEAKKEMIISFLQVDGVLTIDGILTIL